MADTNILSDKIKKAKLAYYDLEPIMSDSEYDALVEELRLSDPHHKEVVSVGSPASSISVWEKVRHEIPMGSLDKVNDTEEFDKWHSKIECQLFFMTHKLDGLSMELVYESGKLVRCVTRGDGLIGEDVTHNVSQIPSVPKNLKDPIDMVVRGEVVMLKSVFEEKYSSSYANPRNTAVAKVREKKGGGLDCANLDLIAYSLIAEDRPDRMSDTMDFLKSYGFQIPSYVYVGDIDYIKSCFNTTKSIRNDIEYEIDGMVISVDNIHDLESMGELNMRPRGQIAWKFDHISAISTALNVKWQVGPSGRVTPVLEVEPVQIGGVTITNISLHNLSMFQELSLCKGNRVLISRRNDVIPYVEKNLDLDDL